MSSLKDIIEQEVRKALKEASYTETDIPKFFWLVTDIDKNRPDKVEQLVSGKLEGIKGISDSKQIIVSWLGIARNTIVILPAKPFLKLNRVSRVMYDNPHYLVSKNLAATFRLFDKSQGKEQDWSTIIERILDYMQIAKKQGEISKGLGTIMYYINRGDLSSIWFGKIFKETKPTINTVKDLAAWFKEASIQVASDRAESLVKYAKSTEVGEWEQLVFDALKHVGGMYESEGEWLVKDDSLTIPPGSTVLVALDMMPDEISEQANEIHKDPSKRPSIMMSKLRDEVKQLKFIEWIKSFRLEQRYNFNFISMKKFHAYREKLWSQR